MRGNLIADKIKKMKPMKRKTNMATSLMMRVMIKVLVRPKEKEKESLKHSLASCCNPIAGDSVFGFITINEGVKVHKKDCPNALTLQSNFAYRIIKAKWVDSSSDEFTAILKLSGIDNMGIVSDVTQSISGDMNVNINKLNFDSEDGIFTGLISVNVKNKTILNRLINRILKVKGVDKVLRE